MTVEWRKQLLAIVLGLGFFLNVARPVFAARGTQNPPKLLNLYFDWEIPDGDLTNLAKWDIVVFDMDQQARFPEKIRKLRQLNPKVKILAYVDSSAVASARFVEESNFPGYALAHAVPEAWYLHRGTERVSFWPGAWAVNVSDASPKSNGERWADYLPRFIAENVWSSGLWDGIFLDNALPGATWFVGSGIDVNGDGKAEDDATVNAAWKRGWQDLARNLRTRLGSGALIMGNGSGEYADVTNGILFESFPNSSWASAYGNYVSTVSKNLQPSITTINANAKNVNNPATYQSMRFGLGSTMLGDGYFSYDYGTQDHGQTWWYDEYDANLGNASGKARVVIPTTANVVDGVWWRDYERGAVIVNSSGKTQHVDLGSPYERLHGTQDPSVNSGRVELALDLPAQDAILLMRRSEPSTIGVTSAFRNGSFVRIYDAKGAQIRAAFFAQRSDVSGGSTVLQEDVDRDGKLDVLSAADGIVRITYGNGDISSFRVCSGKTPGETSIAVGNADRDAPYEIAVGCPGSPTAAVYELNGTARAIWNAYAPTFRGGVRVAMGDLDGNNLREVVTGAGPTGGPHVRVFWTDGQLRSGGFFAFDKRERGGVSVAVGDVNGDGKDEIIAGSGQGSIPRVRVFTGEGVFLREFTLDSKPSASGVSVSVSDVNGDGRAEILASGVSPG